MTDETAGMGHDCTMARPTCTGCGMTWAEIAAWPLAPCSGLFAPEPLRVVEGGNR